MVLQAVVEQCPHCGYTGWTCMERFPHMPPPLDRLMDSEGRIQEKDAAAILKEFDRVEGLFPQVRLHLCVEKLPEGVDCREFGFWLMNASVPPDETALAGRAWSILLTINRTARTASLTLGYGLDNFISDDQLVESLKAGQRPLRSGRYGDAVTAITTRLCRVLSIAHRQSQQTAARLRNAPFMAEAARKDASRSARKSSY